MSEPVRTVQDAVRQAVDDWLAAHAQFKHAGWALSAEDECDGRYRHWRTRVEPPPPGDTPACDVSIYADHAVLARGSSSIHVPFPRQPPLRSGASQHEHRAGRRVVRFIEDLMNGRVRVRGDSGAPGGYRTYRAGRFGWHEVKDGPQGCWQRFVSRLFGD